MCRTLIIIIVIAVVISAAVYCGILTPQKPSLEIGTFGLPNKLYITEDAMISVPVKNTGTQNITQIALTSNSIADLKISIDFIPTVLSPGEEKVVTFRITAEKDGTYGALTLPFTYNEGTEKKTTSGRSSNPYTIVIPNLEISFDEPDEFGYPGINVLGFHIGRECITWHVGQKLPLKVTLGNPESFTVNNLILEFVVEDYPNTKFEGTTDTVWEARTEGTNNVWYTKPTLSATLPGDELEGELTVGAIHKTGDEFYVIAQLKLINGDINYDYSPLKKKICVNEI